MTATRFEFERSVDFVASARPFLPMYLTWRRRPGGIDLLVGLEPVRRVSWTLTTWEAPGDLRRFLASPEHQVAVRQFGPRMTGLAVSSKASEAPLVQLWGQLRSQLEARAAGVDEAL